MNSYQHPLPELSHLQFAVLQVLGTGVLSGKDLREGLKSNHGIRKSGPAFYQMMARLEDGKFVEGSYTQEIIDGQIIKERQYRVTAAGIRALNHTKRFYQAQNRSGSLRPAFA
jgi:hypothetical protein